MNDPTQAKASKVGALKEVLTEMKLHDITKNFMYVLAENGRLTDLDKMCETYKELMYATRGEVLAKVTSAVNLESDELNQVKDALKGFLEPKEKLVLQTEVKPSILGGLVVDIGDKHIDLSINAQIQKVEQTLRDSV